MSTKQLTGKLALLIWIQKIAHEYGLKVENFTSHFQDGRVLCAMVNYFYPDELDYKTIKTDTKEEILNNHKMAFDIAEKHGVLKLLDPEDMLTPDRNSVMLYMAEMNKVFKPLPKGISQSKKEQALKESIQQSEFQNIKSNVLQNLFNVNNNNNNNTNESSEQEMKEKEEKERLEKERIENIEKEKQEKEQQEKEKQEKEKQEQQEKEQEKERLKNLENEKQEKLRQEKEELERLEKEEKLRLEKEILQRESKEKQEKELKESIEKERQQKEKLSEQKSEGKFHPKMLLVFVYLVLGYLITGYFVDNILLNFYSYLVLAIFFGISKWKPQFNLIPVIISFVPPVLNLLSLLDVELINFSLFIKSLLISKNFFKVHHQLSSFFSFFFSKFIHPLQDLLGVQSGGWSLFLFSFPHLISFVLSFFF